MQQFLPAIPVPWRAAASSLRIVLTAWLTLLGAATVSATELKFSTHSSERETTLDAKGEVRGIEHGGKRAFYVELVRELMDVVGTRSAIEHVPFARGLLRVQSEDNHAFFYLVRTPDRETTIKWVGPLDQGGFSYFYEMASARTGIKTLEDAKAVESIAVLRASVHETTLTALGFKNLYPVNSYASALLMLQKKRVNLTPSGVEGMRDRLRETGVPPEDVVQTPVVATETVGYLGFSKNVPDAVVAKWQAALNQVRKSGRYDQIYKRYYVSASAKR